LFCGGDRTERDHLRRCDGRQGHVEALPAPSEVRALRDAAMAQVAENAAPIFDARGAAEFMVNYLRSHGATAGEWLTIACKAAGFCPHDDRAFGPVFYELVRAHRIRKVGIVKRRRGHGTSGGNVWEAA